MKTIFITGSSSGIGKETAKYFASQGWRVIATMRSPEKETELTALNNVELYPLDITEPAQVESTVCEVLGKFDVDVLFNNAGYGMKSRFEDMTEEAMLRSVDTNILGMVRVTQRFIPFFKKKQQGMILTTTSLAGEMGLILDGAYAADKWAVTGLCEVLYHELAPYNIQVKTIVPGVVKTGFKMEHDAPMDEYKQYVDNQVKMLMPDMNALEEVDEVVGDIYAAVTDGDKDRMCYVTGSITKELYKKRQKMGDEKFRQYIRSILMA